MNARERQQAKGKRFVELHTRPGAFLIPNPWDAGAAWILEHVTAPFGLERPLFRAIRSPAPRSSQVMSRFANTSLPAAPSIR